MTADRFRPDAALIPLMPLDAPERVEAQGYVLLPRDDGGLVLCGCPGCRHMAGLDRTEPPQA